MGAPLQIAYRPKTFEEVAGNESAIEAIMSLLDRDLEHIPHAWLFSGPAGCGKTTLARIVKDALGCNALDYKEFNSGSMRGVDTIREVEQNSRLSPMAGKVKVYLFDEVHNWTKQAQEASLKMLEDAPPNVFFLLATTNPEKLCKAMRTRLTDVTVKPLRTNEVMKLLKSICEKEDVDIDSTLLKKIALSCDGSAREAVKMLDSIIDIEDEEKALELIENTHVGEASVIDLCRALTKGEKWTNIVKLLENITEEPESVRRAVLGYLSKVLLSQGSVHVAEMMEQFEDNYYDTGRAGLILSCFAACKLGG